MKNDKLKRKNSANQYLNLAIALGFFVLAGLVVFLQMRPNTTEIDVDATIQVAIDLTGTIQARRNTDISVTQPPSDRLIDDPPSPSLASGEGFSLDQTLPINPWGFDAALSPDNTKIAYSDIDENIIIHDLSGETETVSFPGSRDFIWSLDWSPDGRYVAAGSGDGRLYVWDTIGDNNYYFDGHYDTIHDVAWSPDGKYLASISIDNLFIWDTEAQIEVLMTEEILGAGTSVDWSPDGTKLAYDGLYVTILPFDDGETGNTIMFEDTEYVGQDSVVWSSDGTLIASSGERAVFVWDAETGKQLQVMFGTLGDIEQVTWHPNGQLIASIADDEAMRIWNVNTGEQVYILDGLGDDIETVEWTIDGTQLLIFEKASIEHNISFWNFEPN